MRRLGVDVGGTFTDLILVDEESGRITVDKVPSTPDDPARGTVQGIRDLCAKASVSLAEIDNLLHGTTVATNIALTHTGAEVGMITTEGMRDILHIARHKKPYNFSLQQELPWQSRPLVKRRHRLTVKERITVPHGDVLTPLDEDEVRERVRQLRDAGVEAVSVCLLHSYLNPAHEQRIKEIVLEEFPDAYLSVSHEVLPLYREFERFSTVCLNAYVGPKVSRYVARFDEAMREEGFTHGVQLMQSSGGMATVEAATQRPVNLLMSGPVAGLIGGIWAGKVAGLRERRHARHGRHVGRHRRRRRRSASHAASARHEDRRLPGDGADGRHRHDRRRRRLDRVRRRGRRLPRRSAVGGCRPGPGLLQPRRHGPDLDRRAARAWTPAARPGPARRRDAARPLSCASGDGERRSTARHVRGGGRARGAADPEVRHGAGDRAQLGSPRLRPARVHARRGRRCRPAVRVRSGARARDRTRARAALSGHRRRRRAARDRPRARVRRHRASPAEDPRPRKARTSLRRARRPGRRTARVGRRARGPAPRPPSRRLPLRGSGLRGALRRAARRVRRCLGRRAEAGVPPGARGGVRAPLRSGHRDHQHPRRRHRPRRRARADRARARRRRPLTSSDARARSRVRGRRQAGDPADAVLRAWAAARRRSCRWPGCDRAIRHDYRRAARPRRRDRPVRQHRRRLLGPRALGRLPRRRSRDADPDARHRRRLRGDRQGDGRRPVPHVLLVDHP